MKNEGFYNRTAYQGQDVPGTIVLIIRINFPKNGIQREHYGERIDRHGNREEKVPVKNTQIVKKKYGEETQKFQNG
jgi:hypothetical protein